MNTECPTKITRLALIERLTEYARECAVEPGELLNAIRDFCNAADAPVATKASTEHLLKLCRRLGFMTRGAGEVYTFYAVALRAHPDISEEDFVSKK